MMGCAELHLFEPTDGTADPPQGFSGQAADGDAATRRALAALMADFFYLVSFAAGTYPRYAQVRALFVPGGLLVRGTEAVPHVQTVEQFAQGRHAEVEAGALTQFHEWSSASTRRCSATWRSASAVTARARLPGPGALWSTASSAHSSCAVRTAGASAPWPGTTSGRGVSPAPPGRPPLRADGG